MREYLQLISNHFGPILGVIGALLGTSITQYFNYISKNKEFKLRVSEKLIERRINAHEEIILISKKMRSVINLPKKPSEFEKVITYPLIFSSRDKYFDFFLEFNKSVNNNSHLLTNDLLKYLNYVLKYLSKVNSNFEHSFNEDFPKIGIVLEPDFLNISSEIEKKTMVFFKTEAFTTNIKNINSTNFLYTIEKIEKLLSETELIKKRNELEIFIVKDEI